MDYIEILKIIAPIAAAFVGVGGIGAYYKYQSEKPKSSADAQKVTADVVVTFAEGWRMYAQKLETRLDEVEKKSAQRQQQSERDFETLQKQIDDYRLIIRNKDERIASLEQRVEDLESELKKYTTKDVSVVVEKKGLIN